ncbi:hypothetical protein ACLMJK_000781 [Lecanora helva]
MDAQREPDPPASELFRKFSFEVESQMPPNYMDSSTAVDSLSVAVVATRKKEDFEAQQRAEWRRYFEPWKPSDDPEIQKLDIQGNALSQAWDQFKAKLPPEEQIEFAKRPQNFQDVINVVGKVEEAWQQKKKKGVFGHTKRYFRRICTVINSHSTLLEMLPSSSQYVSIFCGTLQTLIKASTNYDNIAEGLSRSLFEITEAVESCVRDCRLYPTKEIQYGVADLYAHIFLFLRDTLAWYTKKSIRRVLASFNEDFYEQFEDQISNIRSISLRVTRMAQHASHSELRYTRLLMEDMRDYQRLGLEQTEREAADRKYHERKSTLEREKELERARLLEQEESHRVQDLLQRMGESFKVICVEQVSKILEEHHIDSIGTRSGWRAQGAQKTPRDALGDGMLKDESGLQRKDDIQLYTSNLEDYFDRNAFMIDCEQAAGTFVEWPVVAALQEWTPDTESQFLCIVGPNLMTGVSSTSLIAAKYARSTAEANIPMISFFCELQRKRNPQDATPEEMGLISLAYALIRQLTELLPTILGPRIHLELQRFQALDGTLTTFAEALAILKDLLDLSPPVLFCVIDGFEKLDDPSTRRCLADFITALRGHRSGNGDTVNSRRTLKFLFTTAGRSRCLLDHLAEHQLIFAEQSTAGRKPGKPARGRRALSPAAFSHDT